MAEGPKIERAIQTGKEISLSFKNAQKLQTRNKEALTGFEVLDEKGMIYSPRAEIRANRVVLSLNNNNTIIRVLYAYHPFTRANLENEAGLPGGTFSIMLIKE